MKDPGSSGGTRTGAIIALLAVGVIVAILAVLAYARTQGSGAADPPAPFTTPSASPTATVSPTPRATSTPSPAAPATKPSATERFLTVGGNALWRATAGACGGAEPLVQRSTDAGRTWTDVTPRYRHIAQVASVDPLGNDGAQMVAATGADCTVQGLRTYTAGTFWEPNADSLTPARYLNLANAAQVVAPGGPIAAPCPAAHGVRATGDVVALVCDQFAYVRTGTTWTKLSSLEVLAVAVSGKGEIIVAHTGVAGCSGLALARFANAAVAAPAGAGCAQVPTTGPLAIAASADGTYVWAGDTVSLVH